MRVDFSGLIVVTGMIAIGATSPSNPAQAKDRSPLDSTGYRALWHGLLREHNWLREHNRPKSVRAQLCWVGQSASAKTQHDDEQQRGECAAT